VPIGASLVKTYLGLLHRNIFSREVIVVCLVLCVHLHMMLHLMCMCCCMHIVTRSYLCLNMVLRGCGKLQGAIFYFLATC